MSIMRCATGLHGAGLIRGWPSQITTDSPPRPYSNSYIFDIKELCMTKDSSINVVAARLRKWLRGLMDLAERIGDFIMKERG